MIVGSASLRATASVIDAESRLVARVELCECSIGMGLRVAMQSVSLIP